jgi:hypothetical protein
MEIRLRKNEIPETDWGMDKLGEFASKLGRRTALDAWRLGRACEIVFNKCDGDRQKWGEWLKHYIPFAGHSTVDRYITLSKRFPDPTKLEDMALTEAYYQSGILLKRTRADFPEVSAPKVAEPKQRKDDGTPPTDKPSANLPPASGPQVVSVQHEELLNVVQLANRMIDEITALKKSKVRERRECLAKVDPRLLARQIKTLQALVGWLQGALEELTAKKAA